MCTAIKEFNTYITYLMQAYTRSMEPRFLFSYRYMCVCMCMYSGRDNTEVRFHPYQTYFAYETSIMAIYLH